MNSITKKYTVIRIERLLPFIYLIELTPVHSTVIDIKPEEKPVSEEEKYVLRMVKALQKYEVLPVVASHTKSKSTLCFTENNLEIIVNVLDFNVGDEIELTIKKVGN